MRLLVGTNFDPGLVPRIAQLDPAHRVKAFYGAIDAGPLGGGISHGFAPDGHRYDVIRDHVSALHRHGYDFSYVFNTTCLSNQEYEPAFWESLREFLGFLASLQVTSLVLANPYLIEKIKKHFTAFSIKASVLFGLDTLQKINYLDQLGVEGIVLDDQVNRDFDLLRLIRAEYAGEIVLLANQNCIYSCPYRYGHKSFLSHAPTGTAEQLDYSYLLCSLAKMQDPSLFISSRWIRPEDVQLYEDLGIDTIKLGMRSYPTEGIVRAVGAYLDGRYEGNLLDILYGNYAHSLQVPVSVLRSGEFDDLLGADALSPAVEGKPYVHFKLPAYFVKVNNRVLDGFLSGFLARPRCQDRSCVTCGYCAGVARQAVERVDPEKLRRYVALLNAIKSASL